MPYLLKIKTYQVYPHLIYRKAIISIQNKLICFLQVIMAENLEEEIVDQNLQTIEKLQIWWEIRQEILLAIPHPQMEVLLSEIDLIREDKYLVEVQDIYLSSTINNFLMAGKIEILICQTFPKIVLTVLLEAVGKNKSQPSKALLILQKKEMMRLVKIQRKYTIFWTKDSLKEIVHMEEAKGI